VSHFNFACDRNEFDAPSCRVIFNRQALLFTPLLAVVFGSNLVVWNLLLLFFVVDAVHGLGFGVGKGELRLIILQLLHDLRARTWGA
jgi:hypothetical protein